MQDSIAKEKKWGKKMSGNFAIKGGGVGRLMANAILNFHFDFLTPSLTLCEGSAHPCLVGAKSSQPYIVDDKKYFLAETISSCDIISCTQSPVQFAEPEGQEEIESPTHSCLNWPLREFLNFFVLLAYSGILVTCFSKIIINDIFFDNNT